MATGTIKSQPYIYTKRYVNEVGITYSDHSSAHQNYSLTESGARPIGIVGITGSGTGKFSSFDYYISADGTSASVYYRNDSGGNAVLTRLSIDVLYVRE